MNKKISFVIVFWKSSFLSKVIADLLRAKKMITNKICQKCFLFLWSVKPSLSEFVCVFVNNSLSLNHSQPLSLSQSLSISLSQSTLVENLGVMIYDLLGNLLEGLRRFQGQHTLSSDLFILKHVNISFQMITKLN
jgi:hypothetical protein